MPSAIEPLGPGLRASLAFALVDFPFGEGVGTLLAREGGTLATVTCIDERPGGEHRVAATWHIEGDQTLSLILSKAVLLAADDKITDPVTLRQL
jgi:hypothetical protein